MRSRTSLRCHPKLLGLLQEGKVQKFGSIEPLDGDVCIVAARNGDLYERVRNVSSGKICTSSYL